MYEWVKAAHLVAVISWMAGLLYLPRLFVYHCGAEPGSAQSETFKVMERRLLKAIMTPAMIASWVFGLWLGWLTGAITAGDWWFWIKFAAVIGLSACHGLLAVHVRDFAADRNTRPHVYFRVLNEVPTVLMVVAVIMVVVRPF